MTTPPAPPPPPASTAPSTAPLTRPPARIPPAGILALVMVALVPALVAYGLFHKTKYFALEPGPATDVSRLIHVTGSPPPPRGEFLITTVSVTLDTINEFENLRAIVDPVIITVERSALFERGVTNEQQDQINQADMEQSKYTASVVAVAAAGRAVTPIPGARVIKVFDGSPAARAGVKEGDVIESIDGSAVATVTAMSAAIRGHTSKDPLTVGILRGTERLKLSVGTTRDPADPSHPIIGIRPAPAFRLPVEVKIDSQDIVGPSGGLIFSLAIADALDPSDLTGGHKVAATGTIDLDGQVGPIGGIQQKVHGAEYVGADIFICPADEAADARAAASSIKVYGVRNITEAVALLRKLTPLK